MVLKNSKINRIAEKVLQKDSEFKKLSDEDLKQKTTYFKKEIKKSIKNGKSLQKALDDILVDAFAVAREASFRVLGKKHYKVQIMGGIVLHQGNIAEMKTGEGKTLTAILPVYLNALSGKGVHVITVNEYLSQRDMEEMKPLYNFLGLSIGLNNSTISPPEKKVAYECDITYSTNSEIGFDYLRDNMAKTLEERTQRGLNYIVIDEIDSALIDEAKTPLIISGGGSSNFAVQQLSSIFTKNLKPTKDKKEQLKGDFFVDVKTKVVRLTDRGVKKAEKYFGIKNLYDLKYAELVHSINQSLKARFTMFKNVDYVVSNNEILIVDQFTGRIMEGRRFSDGLHQALETKEHVKINTENKTLATITFQNLFRMYDKISGMTGTGKTEENEFKKIYNMKVIEIPTNKPILRVDDDDIIFATKEAKFAAVTKRVKKFYKRGQPVLIGTASIESSEQLSVMFTQAGIKHRVLNAKQNKEEADIIANAGQVKSITISTNMAGRGTDIKLSEESKKLGGLVVIGTEKYESRRIDNQLRGRSGRQGDPGYSIFYLSVEDDLLVRYGMEKLQNYVDKSSKEPIQSKLLIKAVKNAQIQVEGNNFDARKQVLEYDEVMKLQRDLIYSERTKILKLKSLKNLLRRSILNSIYSIFDPINDPNQELSKISEFYTNKPLILKKPLQYGEISADEIYIKLLYKKLDKLIFKYNVAFNPIMQRELINIIDDLWIEHIDFIDQLRKGIFLRAYAQTDPLREYREECHQLFENLLQTIENEITKKIIELK